MADGPRRDDVSPGILAISMILGAIVGFAIWMATDSFVFLPVFIGAGLTVGLALGMRDRDEED